MRRWLLLGAVVLAGSASAQKPAYVPRHCGYFRWAVKTLSDKDTNTVTMQPESTSVSALSRLAPPFKFINHRIAPVEFQVYRVRGVIKRVNLQRDFDFHVVIADPDSANNTMIVEIPLAGCIAHNAVLASKVAASRAFARTVPAGALVNVVGVGFFDPEHGQPGHARNGVELHPVISISR